MFSILHLSLVALAAYAPAPGPGCTMPPATAFSQPVAGTTLSIEMIPVSIDDRTIWIARDETSWDLYDAFVYRLDQDDPTVVPEGGVTRPTKPYIMADRGWGHANFPALSVSSRGAEAFCTWMSDKTGRLWRLPTVKEWTTICAGAAIDAANRDDHAWHKGNSRRHTHELGSRTPDVHGLNDLQGNVSEWCVARDDSWVLMGAHFRDVAEACTCAQRRDPVPEWNDTDPQIPKSTWWLSDAPFAGFRVVCEAPPPSNGPEGATAEEKDRGAGS